MVEGSLEAPTRHPIAWQEPDFYDKEKLDVELRRVFDICHGCRRCFNLCDSFPQLFDLIDEAETGELDSVDSKDFKPVVDACTLCDMCFMTKCPYVPPHEFNLDFPHLMLRYRAIEQRDGGVGFCRKANDQKPTVTANLRRWSHRSLNWAVDEKKCADTPRHGIGGGDFTAMPRCQKFAGEKLRQVVERQPRRRSIFRRRATDARLCSMRPAMAITNNPEIGHATRAISGAKRRSKRKFVPPGLLRALPQL